ncbi:M48 family metalloprotease [Desulfuromonas sp.]|uniref:M48 family metalloprotease n=1 Tax=Desulfuromonas sp. TaxID=892 RepID=UPI0025BF1F9A|nr:M48 family metalloprotease [Desulfuromonas sp.]
MRFFRCLLSVLLIGGFAVLAGCAVNPVTGKQELSLVSVSTPQEIALGEKAFPQAVQEMGGEYPDPQLSAYVNRVGERLGRLSHRPDLPYRFAVVNDSSPNAFALPGGFIAISRGLLSNLENEAQLASVLGHEVGHVTARHSVQGLQRGTLFNVGLAVLSGVAGNTAYGPLAQQAGELTAGLLENSYSRGQERESDQLGIDYMVQAGYNPLGAVQVQEYFYRQLEGGAEPMWLTGLFRTHPFSKDRMLDNQDYIRSAYPQALTQERYSLLRQPFESATARLRQAKGGYEIYDQARRLEQEGDLNKAIATYLQAAAAAPDESLILTGLGLAYLKADDLNSARIHLSRAVQLGGKYYQSRLGLGYVLLQRGQAAQAVRELESSMQLLPTMQGAFFLAQAYEKEGQVQKALELYRAVAQADPRGEMGQAAAERSRALEGGR